MRAVVQRVSRGEVRVDGRLVGSCGRGLVLLVAVALGDAEPEARRLAARIASLRIFGDAAGKMNLSLAEVGDPASAAAEVLAVPNFTVLGDASGSRRPSFARSAPFAEARAVFEAFVAALRGAGLRTATGEFGADMTLELVNDGPVTLVLET